MAGIYIHIPFCASRCIYCGFYSTVQTSVQDEYTTALCRELALRKDYLQKPVTTVYLGGGTPSQLSAKNLKRIFTTIDTLYGPCCDMEEVTMECNPDDVTEEMCHTLQQLPINRVSMGAQTFSDERLRFLHRRHNAEQVALATQRLRAAGISNISLDLMFGFPDESLFEWEEDIWMALALNPQHISAYSLMYEEGTPLYRMLERSEVKEVDEELALGMYNRLIDMLTEAGYEHYEISNFARPGFRSRHNSSYWHGVPYLGIGAAAHSYNGKSRQWNVSNVGEYIRCINLSDDGKLLPELYEREELDITTRYNDLVTTALRTREGISMEEVKAEYGQHLLDYMLANARQRIAMGDMAVSDGRLHITRQGIFISDDVMSDLIYTGE